MTSFTRTDGHFFKTFAYLSSAVKDSDYYYYGNDNSGGSPYGFIYKVSRTTHALVDTLVLNVKESSLNTAFILGRNAYFVSKGADPDNSKVIKVDLDTFTRVGALTLSSDGAASDWFDMFQKCHLQLNI